MNISHKLVLRNHHCILIQNNDENMLIDAGNNEDGEKLVKIIVVYCIFFERIWRGY